MRLPRITPAHAGTTKADITALGVGGDHPRSRGDNAFAAFTAVISMGSPPLTRGQLFFRAPTARRRRITPAHAGTTDA